MAKAWMLGAALVVVASSAHAQDAQPVAPPPPALAAVPVVAAPAVEDDAPPRALNALIADEANSDRQVRRMTGWMTFGFGAGVAVAGSFMVAFPNSLDPNDNTGPRILGGGLIGIGVASMILGPIFLVVPTAVEDLAADYAKTMKDGGLSASTKLTILETRLRALAETQRAARIRGGIYSIVVGSLAAPAGIALGLVSPFPRPFTWVYGGLFGTLGFMDVCLGVWSLTVRRDPAERLLRTWLLGTGRGDGGLTVSPQVGGGMLGWHGTF
jgi:hypothetical protein